MLFKKISKLSVLLFSAIVFLLNFSHAQISKAIADFEVNQLGSRATFTELSKKGSVLALVYDYYLQEREDLKASHGNHKASLSHDKKVLSSICYSKVAEYQKKLLDIDLLPEILYDQALDSLKASLAFRAFNYSLDHSSQRRASQKVEKKVLPRGRSRRYRGKTSAQTVPSVDPVDLEFRTLCKLAEKGCARAIFLLGTLLESNKHSKLKNFPGWLKGMKSSKDIYLKFGTKVEFKHVLDSDSLNAIQKVCSLGSTTLRDLQLSLAGTQWMNVISQESKESARTIENQEPAEHFVLSLDQRCALQEGNMTYARHAFNYYTVEEKLPISVYYFYFSKDSEYASPRDFYDVGKLLFEGQRVKQNQKLGVEYLLKSANSGHSPAMGWVILQMVNNQSIFTPMQKLCAAKILKKDTPGIGNYLLGYYYLHGIVCEKDYPRAVRYFEKSLSCKDTEDDTRLECYEALTFLYSEGLDFELRDYKKAIKYAEEGIKLGSVNSYHNLGVIYNNSTDDSLKNLEKAVEYYRIGSEKGILSSDLNLAILYSSKESMLDFSQARQLFQKVATAGVSQGYLGLGMLAFNGFGQEVNYLQAQAYFKKAIELGDSKAPAFLYLAESLLKEEKEQSCFKEIGEDSIEYTYEDLPEEQGLEEEDNSIISKTHQKDSALESTNNTVKTPEEKKTNINSAEEDWSLQAFQDQWSKDRTKKKLFKQTHIFKKFEQELQMDSLKVVSSVKKSVSSSTQEFVNAVFGKGKKSIVNYKNKDAVSAFKELGCIVTQKKRSGESRIKGSKVKVIFTHPNQSIEKLTYHKPHGHGKKDKMLYFSLKKGMQRFLSSIGAAPEPLTEK